MRDGVRLSLAKLSKEVGRAKAAVPTESSLARGIGAAFGEEWLASVVNSVTERMYVDGVRLLDTDVRMMAVKSGLINGGFHPSIHN